MKNYTLPESVLTNASFGLYFIEIHPQIREMLQFNLGNRFKSNRITNFNAMGFIRILRSANMVSKV